MLGCVWYSLLIAHFVHLRLISFYGYGLDTIGKFSYCTGPLLRLDVINCLEQVQVRYVEEFDMT